MGTAELRKLLLGTALWSVGTQIAMVTQTFYVYEITESEFQLAILGASTTLAMVIVPIAGGILADRIDCKTIWMIGTVMTGVAMLAVGFLIATDLVAAWHIQLAGAIQGASHAIVGPARFALLPTMVQRSVLPRAVSFDMSTFNLGRLVAPAIWGTMLAFLDYEWTYFAVTLVLGFCFIVIATFRPMIAATSQRVHRLTSDIGEITSIVRRNPILNGNLIFTVTNGLVAGGFIYLLTPVAVQVFDAGPTEYSQLFTIVSVGTFVGTLALGFSGGIGRTGYALLATNIIAAMFVTSFALMATISPAYAITFLYGLFSGVHTGLVGIALQTNISQNVRGRLAGLYEIAWAGFPAGGFIFPAIAGLTAPSIALVIAGVFLATATVAMAMLNPRLRNLVTKV